MRHVLGLLIGLSLLVLVVFATLGVLNASAGKSSAWPFIAVAIGAGMVMVIGIVVRDGGPATTSRVRRAIGAGLGPARATEALGDSQEASAARRAIGGLGLVVAPIVGSLTCLALLTEPSAAPALVVLTLAALMAWAQGIAAQVGLSFRIAFVWLSGLALVSILALALAVAVEAVVVDRLGWGRGVARFVFIGILGTGFGAWSLGRTDRLAAPAAVGRAALGRVQPGDIDLLNAGPLALLLRRSPPAVPRDVPDLDPAPTDKGPLADD